MCNLEAEPQTVLWRETVYFLIDWHWNFTFLSCILVAWPSYLVTLLVQIFFHQEFLRVSSGYCEKLLVHSDFSPDVALSQTVVPPGLCSEFLLPLETKMWYICISVHDLLNSITFIITNTVVVNAIWPLGQASEPQLNTILGDFRFRHLRIPCDFTDWLVHESIYLLSKNFLTAYFVPGNTPGTQILIENWRPTLRTIYISVLFLPMYFS